MKAFSVTVFIACCCVTAVQASQNVDRAHQLEESGDAMGARTLLARAAQNPGDVNALREYAEFLDHYSDPAAKDAYTKLLAALDKPGDKQQRAAVARRLAEISTLNGDRPAALQYLETYRQAGVPGPYRLGRPTWVLKQATPANTSRYRGRCTLSIVWPRFRANCSPTNCSPRWRAT
jgi:hypothetical protein